MIFIPESGCAVAKSSAHRGNAGYNDIAYNALAASAMPSAATVVMVNTNFMILISAFKWVSDRLLWF